MISSPNLAKMDKTQGNCKCRLSGERNKTKKKHIINECSNLDQKKVQGKVWLGKEVDLRGIVQATKI